MKKVDETEEIPAHSSAVYAASVGENYLLEEAPTQEAVTEVTFDLSLIFRQARLDEEVQSHD